MKTPDTGGFPGEQGVQQLDERGDYDRRFPSFGEQFLLIQLLIVFICALYIGVLFKDLAVILYVRSDLFFVLVQDA